MENQHGGKNIWSRMGHGGRHVYSRMGRLEDGRDGRHLLSDRARLERLGDEHSAHHACYSLEALHILTTTKATIHQPQAMVELVPYKHECRVYHFDFDVVSHHNPQQEYANFDKQQYLNCDHYNAFNLDSHQLRYHLCNVYYSQHDREHQYFSVRDHNDRFRGYYNDYYPSSYDHYNHYYFYDYYCDFYYNNFDHHFYNVFHQCFDNYYFYSVKTTTSATSTSTITPMTTATTTISTTTSPASTTTSAAATPLCPGPSAQGDNGLTSCQVWQNTLSRSNFLVYNTLNLDPGLGDAAAIGICAQYASVQSVPDFQLFIYDDNNQYHCDLGLTASCPTDIRVDNRVVGSIYQYNLPSIACS